MSKSRLKTLVIEPFDVESVKLLDSHPSLDCIYCPGISDDELVDNLVGVEVIILRGARSLNSNHINAAPNLKYICVAASAADKIDIQAAEKKGVEVIFSPGISYEATAELAVANTVAILRHLPAANQMMKAGIWNRSTLIGERISGKSALILGYGNMGQKIAQHLKLFGANVSAWSRTPKSDLNVKWEKDLPNALLAADLIFVCLPSTEKTRGLLNSDMLALIKPSSVLVNTSRADIVDQQALLQRLTTGQLRGAVIDVWIEEPRYNLELAKLDNVIASPHIGGNTKDTHLNMVTHLLDEIDQRGINVLPLFAEGAGK